MEAGIEGGAGISTAYQFKDKQDYVPQLSYTGGIFFQYQLNNSWALCTNLFYERKDFCMKTEAVGASEKMITVKEFIMSDYLDIPFLVRVSFGRNVRFFLNAGPYFGYLLRQIQLDDVENTTVNQPINRTSIAKKWDMGISAGLGVNIPISKTISLSAELRDNFGLLNTGGPPGASGIKLNSTHLLVGVGYRFGGR